MLEAPAAVTFRTSDDNSVVCLCTKNRVDGAIAQVMAQRVLRPWVARTGLSPQHLSVLLAAAGLFLWLGPVLVAPPHPGFRGPLALGLSVWLMYNMFQSWTLRDRRPLDQMGDTLPPVIRMAVTHVRFRWMLILSYAGLIVLNLFVLPVPESVFPVVGLLGMILAEWPRCGYVLRRPQRKAAEALSPAVNPQ
jgi:hypothetical protein